MDRVGRPSYTGCLDDGLPTEENRGPAPAKFGTPCEGRMAPKPTPPPRAPTPPATSPPPWNPPAWKPPPPWKPPPLALAPPPPPPACPPPPPPNPPPPPPWPLPWPAAHPALARAIDVMPTKLSNFNFFMFQDRDSFVSGPLRIR